MIDRELGGSPEVLVDKFDPVVIILDGGAQYVDMIKKATERQGFPAVVLPIETPMDEFPTSTEAIIVSGGPGNSYKEGAKMPDSRIWQQQDVPSLGICYGMQALAVNEGGQVGARQYRTNGRRTTKLDSKHPLFTGVREESTALFTHGDFVDSVPEHVDVIGQHTDQSGNRVISAIAAGNHIGVQFHPEVFDDTPQGYEMFGNFFKYIAQVEPNEQFLVSQMERQIQDKRAGIEERVGESKHLVAFVSGGVDSAVAAKLATGVVSPDRLHMYYINNGFMRDEDDNVIDQLRSAGMDVQTVEAEEYFEQATAEIDGKTVGPLIDVVNPIHKRRIIGEAFVDVQDKIVKELGLTQDEVVLLQGTNAADRIESGHSKGNGQATEQIKEHHNMVQRVRDLDPLEPLDDLFKDEIRALAVALKLPDDLAYRQPFPGPGTSIRILGLDEDGFQERPAEHGRALQEAVDRLNQKNKSNLNTRLFPVRSVGVGGDSRSHIEAIALEGQATPQSLRETAETLTDNFPGLVNRVVFKLGGGELNDLKPIQTKATRPIRNTLRHADSLVSQAMRDYGVLRDIEQMPVVLLSMGSEGERSIVLRPIKTRTHLTVQAMLPGTDLPEEFFETVTNRILSEVDGISHVFLDLTNKPPATTEWE